MKHLFSGSFPDVVKMIIHSHTFGMDELQLLLLAAVTAALQDCVEQ